MANATQHGAAGAFSPPGLDLVRLAREGIEMAVGRLISQLSLQPVTRFAHIMLRSAREVEATLREHAPGVRVSPDEFIAEMEGFIKRGSRLPVIDPLKLKDIWTRGQGAERDETDDGGA